MAICNLEENKNYEGVYILESHCTKMTKTGKPYLEGVVSDKTGTAQFKMWDAQGTFDLLEDGGLVKITFKTEVYKGALQLSLYGIWPERAENVEDLSEIVAVSDEKPEDMMAEIEATLNAFQDADLRKVVQAVLVHPDIKDKFPVIPGGKKKHHDMIHGLLKHSLGVLRVCKGIAEQYPEGSINKDLLYAGAILHDVGKVYEFNISSLGLVSNYTVPGNLEGHPFMGAMLVDQVCRTIGLDEEKQAMLVHLILSHHEKPEWGAVKIPATTEAFILAHADMLDSHITMFLNANREVEPGTYGKSFNLDQHVYVPAETGEE